MSRERQASILLLLAARSYDEKGLEPLSESQRTMPHALKLVTYNKKAGYKMQPAFTEEIFLLQMCLYLFL